MIECFACKVFWCQISASATSVSHCLLFVMGETAASQAWSDTLDRVGKKDNETGEGLSGSWRIGKKTEEWIQMGRASLKKSDKKNLLQNQIMSGQLEFRSPSSISNSLFWECLCNPCYFTFVLVSGSLSALLLSLRKRNNMGKQKMLKCFKIQRLHAKKRRKKKRKKLYCSRKRPSLFFCGCRWRL